MLTLSLAELIKSKSEKKDIPEGPAMEIEPEKDEKGQKGPDKANIDPEPINPTSGTDKAVKTQIGEKLPDADKLLDSEIEF